MPLDNDLVLGTNPTRDGVGQAEIEPSKAQNIHVCGLPGSHAIAPAPVRPTRSNSLTGAFTDSATDLSLPGVAVSFRPRPQLVLG